MRRWPPSARAGGRPAAALAWGLRAEGRGDEDFALARLPPGIAVHPRGSREVRVGLPLDDDAAIDDVVTDGESLEVDCKVVGLLEQIQKRRVSFGKVDAELIPPVGVRDIGFWRGSQKSAMG
jgi:hypothetical protein